MDVSVSVSRFPDPGETLLALSSRRSGGGKGANQAVASARAGGALTTMVAAVGADADGDALVAGMSQAGVDMSLVQRLPDAPTGVALITVDTYGENTIVVASGANAQLELDDASRAAIASADVVLAQLEVPQELLVSAARSRRPGVAFVLNAAPSDLLLPELADEVDLLVVNEPEAVDMAGFELGAAGDDLDEDNEEDVVTAMQALRSRFPGVVLTLGAAGVIFAKGAADPLVVKAPTVTATDTVGAGDTFCGVLVAQLAQGAGMERSLQFACAAASLAVQRAGAQDAVPTVDEVRARTAEAYG